MAKGRVCLAYSGTFPNFVCRSLEKQERKIIELTSHFQAVSIPAAFFDGSSVKFPTMNDTPPSQLPQLIIATEEGYDVVCFLANVGQEEDWAAVEKKALTVGAKKMIIEDLRKEFITELCFPAIRMCFSCCGRCCHDLINTVDRM
jgi:hypothetical protein